MHLLHEVVENSDEALAKNGKKLTAKEDECVEFKGLANGQGIHGIGVTVLAIGDGEQPCPPE
jgi:hypothetical protein